jgi:glycosyltransferase involved in cell wall biosynthesis
MMRVGIDISRTIEERTGVGWYTSHLVRGIARVDRVNQYHLYPCFWYCIPGGFRKAEYPRQPNVHLADRWLTLGAARQKWGDPELGRVSTLGNVDVLHCTAYTAPSVYEVGLVVTIHDMSFLTHPQFHEQGNIEFCTRECHRAARRAAKIIAPSEATKRDVMRYLHVEEDRIQVVYEAAGEEFSPVQDREAIRDVLAAHAIHHNYILFVGTVEPRKNLKRLLEAFLHVVRSRPDRGELLVVAGGRGWRNTDIYGFVEESGLTNRVRFLGYVSDFDLRVLYSAATMFAYPSLYEGFGLPVIEAMACGCPVVTSRVSSLPEVAGDAGLLVEPADVGSIAGAVEAVLADRELRHKLRAAGLDRAAQFSWDKAAMQTIRVYEQAASPEWRRPWGGS